MSDLPDRDARMKRRDALQARAVEQAVREYLPQYNVAESGCHHCHAALRSMPINFDNGACLSSSSNQIA
jgi:hypothetical protein